MTGCSSDEMLARLLDEQLDQDDYSSIAEHVQVCACCQERLKKFTSDFSHRFEWEPRDPPDSDPSLTSDGTGYGPQGTMGVPAVRRHTSPHVVAGRGVLRIGLSRGPRL